MPDPPVTMLLTGDNLIVDYERPETVYDLALPTLRTADILFGNLEVPISDRGEPIVGRPVANTAFRMRPETIEAFAKAGFHVMSLANNASMGYGPVALMDTIEAAARAGIVAVGAGRSFNEAHRPRMLSRNGTRVAFLAYSTTFMPSYPATADRPGIAAVWVDTAYQPHPRLIEQPGGPAIVHTIPRAESLERIQRDIQAAREAADVVVASWHWGLSQSLRTLIPYQVQLAHHCIDSGADLVVGHHPHMLHGIEVYRGKVIAYSLGNFACYIPEREHWPHMYPQSMVLKCAMRAGRIERVSYLPVVINDRWQPEPVAGARAEPVHAWMREAQRALGLPPSIEGDEVTVLDTAGAPAS